jgi:hypothetical protein
VGDWRGPVALALAVLVGAGWAVALVAAVLHPDDLSRTGRLLLYTLGGALVGGLIGWLGSPGRRKDDDEPGP